MKYENRIQDIIRKVNDKKVASDIVELLDDLLSEIDSIQSKTNELRKQLTECKSKNDELIKTINVIKTEYQALVETINELDENSIISDLKDDIKTVINRISDVEKALSRQIQSQKPQCRYSEKTVQIGSMTFTTTDMLTYLIYFTILNTVLLFGILIVR